MVEISSKTDQSGYHQMIFYAVIADVQRYLERLMILLTCILVRGQGQTKRFMRF